MSYEPETHLPILQRYLEAVQILVNNGFTADPTAYTLASDAQDEDRVEFGIPYHQGSVTYWLNAQSVECVHQWAADHD
jgi:hypothetical protein